MDENIPVTYGPPPQSWLWDSRPLEENSWGNILGFDDHSTSGDIIDMRLWLRPDVQLVNELPMYVPAHAPLPPFFKNGGMRRCYRPSDEDLEIVRRCFPQAANPSAPPWMQVEAKLVAAGRSREELLRLNAPTLLKLIDAMTPRKTTKAGRRPDTDPEFDERVSDAWNSGQHTSHSTLANEMGISVPEVRRALDRHRKR